MYISIQPEQLMTDNLCPACGYQNKVGYSGSHTITYECVCCGLATRFINPNEGFGTWELKDYDEEDDGAFMDAVEKAEKDDLDSSPVKHFIPNKKCQEGSRIIVIFLKLNDDCENIVSEFIDSKDKPWRKGRSLAMRFLVSKIFTEFE